MTFNHNQVLQGLSERRPVQSSAIHILQTKRPQHLCQSSCSPSSCHLLKPSPFIRPRQTSVPGQKRSQNPAQATVRLHTATGSATEHLPAHSEGATCGKSRGPRPKSPGPPQHPTSWASSSNAHLWPQTSGRRPEKALIFRAREDE